MEEVFFFRYKMFLYVYLAGAHVIIMKIILLFIILAILLL